MELRHAIRARSLETHHRDEVALEEARLECRDDRFLGVEHQRRRFDDVVGGLHGRHLEDAAAEVAAQHPQAAIRAERRRDAAHDLTVEARSRPRPPAQPPLDERRLLGVAPKSSAHHCQHVIVQEPGAEELAQYEARAAGRLEVIHIGLAVRVYAREQRHGGGQLVEIVPVHRDAGGGGDRDQVNRVIGGAAGRQQRHDAVDDRAFVDDLADRQVLRAERGDLRGTRRGPGRQVLAQRRPRPGERAAGKVQAERFHQHLVAVGGAVEGAGTRRVVALRFRLEQRLAARLAFGELASDPRLLRVRQARWHWPRRHENHRQVAERERADQQARHDLVADAKAQRRIERVVAERDGGRHCDHVTAEERQLHAGAPLRHAIAHRRNAAGKLSNGTGGARRLLDERRVALERLVRGEHVVVGRDDREVGPAARPKVALIGRIGAGEHVRKICAGEPAPARGAGACRREALEVCTTLTGAALADSLCDALNERMHRDGRGTCHRTPAWQGVGTSWNITANICSYTTL